MTLLNVIAFLGLVAGSFILLSINPLEFAEFISKIFKIKEKTLKAKVIGKAILAICILVIFISLAGVIKLTKPVEYKR